MPSLSSPGSIATATSFFLRRRSDEVLRPRKAPHDLFIRSLIKMFVPLTHREGSIDDDERDHVVHLTSKTLQSASRDHRHRQHQSRRTSSLRDSKGRSSRRSRCDTVVNNDDQLASDGRRIVTAAIFENTSF